MSGTETLTGARIPTQSDGPLGGLQIANAIKDLADNTIPRFANTTDRDTKYAAWVAAGGTMTNGLVCAVGARLQEYRSGAWSSIVSSTTTRSARRVTNNILSAGASQDYGSASSGEVVLAAATQVRDVDIEVVFDVYCNNAAATGGVIHLFANSTALLGAQTGTFSNRINTTSFAARPVTGTARWAGALPAAAQNIWARVQSDPASQSFWVLAIDLTVIER